jgi:hypothetical protein
MTLLQLPEDKLVLVCKLKFPAAFGHKMMTVSELTRSMFKTGGLVCAVMPVINRLKTVVP